MFKILLYYRLKLLQYFEKILLSSTSINFWTSKILIRATCFFIDFAVLFIHHMMNVYPSNFFECLNMIRLKFKYLLHWMLLVSNIFATSFVMAQNKTKNQVYCKMPDFLFLSLSSIWQWLNFMKFLLICKLLIRIYYY